MTVPWYMIINKPSLDSTFETCVDFVLLPAVNTSGIQDWDKNSGSTESWHQHHLWWAAILIDAEISAALRANCCLCSPSTAAWVNYTLQEYGLRHLQL